MARKKCIVPKVVSVPSSIVGGSTEFLKSQDPVLWAQGVDKTYPNGTHALASVDLRVQSGEFLSLIGPSGCGKSTLLRMFAGLETPSHGHLRWWNLPKLPVRQPDRSIAMVFQEPTLTPWADVMSNVRLPLELSKVAVSTIQQRTREALDLVGLADFHHARPRENKLDADLRRIWQERGLTIIYVTHSIYESVFLSSKVVVMGARPGRIITQLDVPGPLFRDESFRVSEDFMQTCKALSALMIQANQTP